MSALPPKHGQCPQKIIPLSAGGDLAASLGEATAIRPFRGRGGRLTPEEQGGRLLDSVGPNLVGPVSLSPSPLHLTSCGPSLKERAAELEITGLDLFWAHSPST